MSDPSGHSGFHAKTLTIVGAGPAGLVCAIVLARAGWRVVVREMKAEVGGRFQGDFQGLENWTEENNILQDLRAEGVEAGFDAHPVFGGTAFDAWGGRYDITSTQPLYYLVRRGPELGTLDRGLLEFALAVGVDVHFNDRVRRTEGPTVLAAGPRVADAIAAGYVFETKMADGSWICFDSSLAPKGYAYLLIHGGRGTVASCMFSGFKRQADYVEATVDMFRDRAGLDMQNPRPFGGYANFRLPRDGFQGGHMAIGEQAGFQDALAGFGMRYALRSGILAARALIEGGDYTQLWRAALQAPLRTSVSNRFIFNLVGDHGWRWMLRRRLVKGDARPMLRRLYQPSLLTRTVFPLALKYYRHALRDRSCDHKDCACVWCRCGDAENHHVAAPSLMEDGKD